MCNNRKINSGIIGTASRKKGRSPTIIVASPINFIRSRNLLQKCISFRWIEEGIPKKSNIFIAVIAEEIFMQVFLH